jgi:hypothetical protein
MDDIYNLDKKIIYIDSDNIHNLKFLNNESFECYSDILETIKDCIYIKTIKTEVFIDNTYNSSGTTSTFKEGDSIYIYLNDYNRIIVPYDNNTNKYYDSIYINKNPTDVPSFPNKISMKYELSGTSCNPNDLNTYLINKDRQEIQRFDIKLYNNEHQLLKKTDIKRFILKFCIYYKNKKLSIM